MTNRNINETLLCKLHAVDRMELYYSGEQKAQQSLGFFLVTMLIIIVVVMAIVFVENGLKF